MTNADTHFHWTRRTDGLIAPVESRRNAAYATKLALGPPRAPCRSTGAQWVRWPGLFPATPRP